MRSVHLITVETLRTDITCILHQWKNTTRSMSFIFPSQKNRGILLWMQNYATRNWGTDWYWKYDKNCLFPHYIAHKDGDCLVIY